MSNTATVTENGNIIQYKSDDYVKKVFKYFVLELVKNNDENELLTEYEIFTLAVNVMNIAEDNIHEQAECVKNLWDDVMKRKNNYLFAYYLSRLYENRLADDKEHSAQKYFDFSEYIIGLNVDFETLDWKDYNKIKKNKDLDNIYGEKMHEITNEFLKKGYVREVTKHENIDDIIELYIENAKILAYNLKISKITNMTNELDKMKDLKLDEEENVNKETENDDNITEVNEWYYGNEEDKQLTSQSNIIENKKRKFEEIIFIIIKKYEKNKRRKLENKRLNERMEKELNRSRFLENLMKGLCRFCLIYCLVVYFTACFLNLRVNNMNEAGDNESGSHPMRGTEIYDNITKGFMGICGTDYELR